MRTALAAALCLLLVPGCGQKGPLYLRDQPPPGMKPPRPEPYRPVPYPTEKDDADAEKGATGPLPRRADPQ